MSPRPGLYGVQEAHNLQRRDVSSGVDSSYLLTVGLPVGLLLVASIIAGVGLWFGWWGNRILEAIWNYGRRKHHRREQERWYRQDERRLNDEARRQQRYTASATTIGAPSFRQTAQAVDDESERRYAQSVPTLVSADSDQDSYAHSTRKLQRPKPRSTPTGSRTATWVGAHSVAGRSTDSLGFSYLTTPPSPAYLV